MDETAKNEIAFAEFIFETRGNLLFRDRAVVPLEPMAARVLKFLLESGGRLVSKEELLDAVWAEVFTTEDVLKRSVSQIRRALGDSAQNPRFIETHHRRGYRFLVPQIGENQAASPQSEKNGAATREHSIAHIETNGTAASSDPNFDCFVGRAAELNFLQTEFRRVAARENGQPVLIAGDAGIGKTQTAARFAVWAEKEESAVPLRVRFFDYEAAHLPPLDLFFDLLGEACAVVFGASGDKAELRRNIEDNLKIDLPDEFFSGAVEGERRASADASRSIAPLAECFVRLSRLRPLVLLLDDIQWADETSRQIIGYLMRIAANAPLMIVGLTRRGDAANAQKTPFAEWLRAQAAYRSFTTINLFPLSPENCRELIGEVFRGRLDTNAIHERDLLKLHTATDGNPYFVVETLRLLMNEKAIERQTAENGSLIWRWHGISDIPLPETVRMAARAKLVNLSPNALELIENAAVLGDAFQIETLALMTGDGENESGDTLDEALDEAIAAQILTEQNVAGADDCQFYHTTLRRAVYMDLSPRRIKRLHARAAGALEKAHAGELERFAAALAAHREIAGESGAAFRLNRQACRAAANRFDWAEAAEILSRAERVEAKLSNAEKISPTEFLSFLSLRGEIYMSVGRRVEAERVLNEAAELSEKLAETVEATNVLLNLGRTRILLGKYRLAIPVLEKTLAAAETSADRETAAALIQLASAKYALCEYDASCAILQEIIDREPAASYNRAVALGKLGWTRALQSRYSEAKNLLEEAFEFHRAAGDLRERAVLAMCLNWCEYGIGDYEAAIQYAMRARAEAQIVGEPYNESVAMMRIAKARIAQALYEEAETLLVDVQEKQKNLDARHAQAETFWMLGRLRTRTGDTEAARRDLATALEMILEVGDRDDEFRILLDEAALENRLGNYNIALELLERAAKIAEEIEIAEGTGEILIEKAAVEFNLDNAKAAVSSAETAVRILEKINSGELWRAFLALAAAAENEEIKENALRRALALVTNMREQFSENDSARRRQFIERNNAPARAFRELLTTRGQLAEAEEIRREWHL